MTFLKPLLNEQKLTLTFADLPELGYSAEKNEKNWAVKYWKQATLTNSEETTEELVFKFWAVAEGQDLAKTEGSAETYAIKYFLTKFFLIPVTDQNDPDKEQWKSTSVFSDSKSSSKPELTKEEKEKVDEFFDRHK